MIAYIAELLDLMVFFIYFVITHMWIGYKFKHMHPLHYILLCTHCFMLALESCGVLMVIDLRNTRNSRGQSTWSQIIADGRHHSLYF